MQFSSTPVLRVALLIAGFAAFAPDTGYAQSSDAIEEVVVTGIRASLQNSASVKQNSAVVMDAISAEELGKFPDTNVAE